VVTTSRVLRELEVADAMGLRRGGFPGWLVARASHLYQLPLSSRKLRIVAGWPIALFFRRGISELGNLGRPTPLDPR
jgi:hypothetical protein